MAVIIEQPNAPRSRKGAQWEKRAWIFMRVSNQLTLLLLLANGLARSGRFMMASCFGWH